jgi:hypothetical protein
MGNDRRSLREHLAVLKKEYKWGRGLGTRRFLQLHSAFDPSITELRQLQDIIAQQSKR